jgi:DNA invertase Pin-like site-specific DNA recombinase
MGGALAYVRASRYLGDPDDPAFLEAHRATLLRLAAGDGVPLAPENLITEVGSGESLLQRPRFRALVEHWETHPGSGGLLYVIAIDRLGRGSMAETGRIVEALVHAGIEVRTPARRYDLSQPDDELFYSFLSALARHELGRYKARVKLAWDAKTRRGELVSGGDRLGYRWDKNLKQLVVIPEEFAVVQGLFQDAPSMSADMLSAKYGVPPATVLKVLHNPTYTGWPARHMITYRWRNGQGPRSGRMLPLEQWTWPEQAGAYPAAVSREQFDLVQRVLRERCRERTKPAFVHGWCRDRVEFEWRPGARIELGSHRAAGGGYLTYTTRPQDGRRLYVARDIIHAAALATLRRLFAQPDLLAAAAAAYRERQQEAAAPAKDAATLRDALADLRRRHDELLAREVAVTDAEERASIGRVRALLREEMERHKDDLRTLTPPPPPSLPRIDGDFEAAWEQQDEGGRRALVNAMLARIVVRVTPERHPIPWRREVARVEYQDWLADFAS